MLHGEKHGRKLVQTYGDAYPGYDFSAGYAAKLLTNGSIAVLAGYMPPDPQLIKSSLYNSI